MRRTERLRAGAASASSVPSGEIATVRPNPLPVIPGMRKLTDGLSSLRSVLGLMSHHVSRPRA